MLDLGIKYSNDIQKHVNFMKKLDIQGAAYTIEIEENFDKSLNSKISYIKKLYDENKDKSIEDYLLNLESSFNSSTSLKIDFIELERIHLVLNNFKDFKIFMNVANSSKLNDFDLISIQFNEEKSLQALLALPFRKIDIFSLALNDNRLPIPLKRSQIKSIVNLNIFFEIRLREAINSPSIMGNLISNLKSIIKFIPYHKILITTASYNAYGVKSPNDLVYLLQSLNLFDIEKARKIVYHNPRECLRNALARKYETGAILQQNIK